MHTRTRLACLIVVLLSVARPSLSNPLQVGAVCSNPSVPCATTYAFKPYQLPFKIAETPTFGRTYRSVFFYAVILRSSPARNEPVDCGQIPERVRLRTQLMFPGRKVFASHFGCAEELVLYSNVNQSFNFMAVYGGRTNAQARSMLARVRATRRFPGAYIRRMQVILEFST